MKRVLVDHLDERVREWIAVPHPWAVEFGHGELRA